jgi:hypothetical protein
MVGPNMTFDDFTSAYIETALWSSIDDGSEPLDSNYRAEDFSEDTLAEMVADCLSFQTNNAEDIETDPSLAGHDFWLTRNGHGAGFWDGDWEGQVGERLSIAAESYGEVNLYIGDDGKIYS